MKNIVYIIKQFAFWDGIVFVTKIVYITKQFAFWDGIVFVTKIYPVIKLDKPKYTDFYFC